MNSFNLKHSDTQTRVAATQELMPQYSTKRAKKNQNHKKEKLIRHFISFVNVSTYCVYLLSEHTTQTFHIEPRTPPTYVTPNLSHVLYIVRTIYAFRKRSNDWKTIEKYKDASNYDEANNLFNLKMSEAYLSNFLSQTCMQ